MEEKFIAAWAENREKAAGYLKTVENGLWNVKKTDGTLCESDEDLSTAELFDDFRDSGGFDRTF